MRLLLIRHAIAGDRAEFARTGTPDRDRPLTDVGRKKMRANARGLRRLEPDVGVLATSPYARARQTAEILADAYHGLTITDLPALAHGSDRAALAQWLAGRTAERVALVGHEPDLGGLIAWLTLGSSEPYVTLRKGGAALLVSPGAPGPATSELRWVLTPKLLRRLART